MSPWLLLLCCGLCGASRILVFYPGPSGSLLRSFAPFFNELSRRGHELTVVSAYELPSLDKNIPQVLMGHAFKNDEVKKLVSTPFLQQYYYLWQLAAMDCQNLFADPRLDEMLNSNQSYDLFIGSPFYYLECSIAIAHHLKLPILNIFSNRMTIHFSHLAGLLFPASYMATIEQRFPNRMGFWERVSNSVFCLCYSAGLSTFYLPQQDAMVKQRFPHLPPLQEMLSQVPVTLLNTNLAVHPSQPLLPGYVPVAGLTISHDVKLPEDLQAWMDASEQGVVLFSFGSNRQMITLDPEMLKVILEALGRLPQRVLMKWEADRPPANAPANLRTQKWIPQAAVLAHRHCSLLMFHGGLHSWMEAVHYAVPVLGLQPYFFDQFHNLVELQDRGQGRYFTGPWDTGSFHRAISDVLQNPQYKKNMEAASAVFRDRPQSPMDTAVYWAEYVIRHPGAGHLQSVSTSMPYYQLLLLDVIAALVLAMFAIWFMLRLLYRFIRWSIIDYEYIVFNRILRICHKLKPQ